MCSSPALPPTPHTQPQTLYSHGYQCHFSNMSFLGNPAFHQLNIFDSFSETNLFKKNKKTKKPPNLCFPTKFWWFYLKRLQQPCGEGYPRRILGQLCAGVGHSLTPGAWHCCFSENFTCVSCWQGRLQGLGWRCLCQVHPSQVLCRMFHCCFSPPLEAPIPLPMALSPFPHPLLPPLSPFPSLLWLLGLWPFPSPAQFPTGHFLQGFQAQTGNKGLKNLEQGAHSWIQTALA